MIDILCDDSLNSTQVAVPLEMMVDLINNTEFSGLEFLISDDDTVRMPPALFARLVSELDKDVYQWN